MTGHDRWDNAGGAVLWLGALAIVAAPALGGQGGAAWCAFAGVVLGTAAWSARAELHAGVHAFALLDGGLIAGAGLGSLALWPWPETAEGGMDQGLALAANAALVSALSIRTFARVKERERGGNPVTGGPLIGLATLATAVIALLVLDLAALAR